MLSEDARENRYLAQTGRRELTVAQRRRDRKKRKHWSQEALFRRDHAVRVRHFAEVERKRRRDALAPSS